MATTVRDETLRGVLDEPALRAVVRSLPSFEECTNGLCVDRAPVSSIRFNGQARLSVMRLYSKNGRRAKLVGQVHVVAHAAGRETWTVEFFAHDPNFVVPTEISNRKTWWSAVLQRHMEASGLTN